MNPFDVILPVLQPPLHLDALSPLVLPEGKQLHPFQLDGVGFLVRLPAALLADEMGLGKTVQAIFAMRILFRLPKSRGGIDSVLVLCPLSVLTHWERTLREWAPELRVVRIRGLVQERDQQWKMPAHVYVTTYHTFRNDWDELPQLRRRYGLAVLDEAQQVKNPDAQITQAVRKLEADHRWALTGTPLENRLEELKSIFDFLRPGTIDGGIVTSPAKVRKAAGPYVLRRRKSEVLKELPPKIYEHHWLDLTEAQRRTYETVESHGVSELKSLGDKATRVHVFSLIQKLKQICNFEPSTRESCKLDYLQDALEEVIEEGDKALVFSHLVEEGVKPIVEVLNRHQPDAAPLYGRMSAAQRQAVVDAFQKEESPKVLVMSVKAGGLGLTLTRAAYVFHFDHWWSPSTAWQAEDRAHRIGQKQSLIVTSLLVSDTIEERIQDLLNRKKALFHEVVEKLTDEKVDSLLTEEQLFGLFGLQAPQRRAKPQEEQTVHTAPVGKVLREDPLEVRLRELGFDHAATAWNEAGKALDAGLHNGAVAMYRKAMEGLLRDITLSLTGRDLDEQAIKREMRPVEVRKKLEELGVYVGDAMEGLRLIYGELSDKVHNRVASRRDALRLKRVLVVFVEEACDRYEERQGGSGNAASEGSL